MSATEEWIEEPIAFPKEATAECAEFFCHHVACNDFVQHVFSTAGFADKAASLLGVERANPETRIGGEQPKESSGPFTGITRSFLPLMADMIWCRGVDNFLTYLSKLLGVIFRTKPETLRSSKQERLDVVLGFDSMESLIDHLAEKRVHDLAYAGLAKLQDTLAEEIGLSLFPDEARRNRAVRIVEHRNLIVHNRSIVNDLFVKRTGDDSMEPGVKSQVGLVCAMRCLRFLAAAIVDIDARAIQKFSLPSVSLEDRCVAHVSAADRVDLPVGCDCITRPAGSDDPNCYPDAEGPQTGIGD